MTNPIPVTRPFLPPFDEMLPLLRQIWDSRVLTNNGPFHQQFEARLAHIFDGRPVSLVANGTLALSVALDAAELDGEVITTPYSFVATSHAVRLGRLTPVFADVLPGTLTLDPAAVEAAITPRTTAILAVHVYGNPCEVEALEDIARRRGLTLIYDAAHAFGVKLHGRSLLSWGDFSTLSFHATKVFNTFEGGAIVSSAAGKAVVDRLRNFGIIDEVTVEAIGGNAKMNEFSAALGLLQLDHFTARRSELAAIDALYRALLADVEGIELLPTTPGVERNFSYFPVMVGLRFRTTRDRLHAELAEAGITSRRYFYPLLSNLPMYRTLPSAQAARLPVANRAAGQVLCLPIFSGLDLASVRRIAAAVRGETVEERTAEWAVPSLRA